MNLDINRKYALTGWVNDQLQRTVFARLSDAFACYMRGNNRDNQRIGDGPSLC